MPDQPQDTAFSDIARRRVRFTPFEVIHRMSPTGPQELDVRGELDLATVPELRAKLSAARDGARPAVIDLRNCDFTDAAGLNLIIQAHRSAATNGDAPKTLVIARGRIAELFALTEIDSLVTVVGTRPEAHRALAGMRRRPAHARPEVVA